MRIQHRHTLISDHFQPTVLRHFGGLLTGYLFIKQLDLILKAYQLNKNVDLTNNLLQSFFALLFIGAFGFLIYKSLSGMRKRQVILRKPNHFSS